MNCSPDLLASLQERTFVISCRSDVELKRTISQNIACYGPHVKEIREADSEQNLRTLGTKIDDGF